MKKIRLTESGLKRLVSTATKRILREMEDLDYTSDFEQGFYICSETQYDNGTVNTWIGDENDARECENSSEGNAYGPFSTYEEAEQYAEENGMNLGEEDYANNFGNALQDAFGDSLNENELRKLVSKSVRKTLNEAFNRITFSSPKKVDFNKKGIGFSKSLQSHFPNIKVKPVQGDKDGYRVTAVVGDKGVLIGRKGWSDYIYNPKSKSWIGPYQQHNSISMAFMLAAKLEKTMEGPEDSQTKAVRDAYMGGDQYAGMLKEGKKKALKRSKRKLQGS